MGRTILCCVGTRPEVIKMAPVIAELRRRPWARCRVLATGQHRELLQQMLEFFGIAPDISLDVMQPNQTLPALTARLLVGLDEVLAAEQPEIVLAQGDTTTVLAAALAAFYRKIPFGHVEAGLRTHKRYLPFPEEANRVLAGHLASLHFASTASARDNLAREGIDCGSIHVVGNPVIDALLTAVKRRVPIGVEVPPQAKLVLVTAHRRDNHGEPLKDICRAITTLCERYEDLHFLWPVHPNPSVGPVVRRHFNGHARVHLCDPLGYGQFVSAMDRCCLALTDSGGVQEEAPALGKPVLVMRSETERPEAVHAGVARLIGTAKQDIVSGVSRLMDDPAEYRRMSRGGSPYGDGQAARRIVQVLEKTLGLATGEGRLDEFAEAVPGPLGWLTWQTTPPSMRLHRPMARRVRRVTVQPMRPSSSSPPSSSTTSWPGGRGGLPSCSWTGGVASCSSRCPASASRCGVRSAGRRSQPPGRTCRSCGCRPCRAGRG